MVGAKNDHPQLERNLDVSASRQLVFWMAEYRVSFVFTSREIGKVFFVGIQPDGRLSFFERTFEGCFAICGNDQTIYMNSLYQLWRFENALQQGQLQEGYDRLFIPQLAYTTGYLNLRDIAVDKQGRILLVNTLFSCLATVSEVGSFASLWQPAFISKVAPETRCFLSGLAMKAGAAAYVSVFGKTDTALGWLEAGSDSGLIIDVATQEIVAAGLSFPTSPRMYRDKLWVLNAGTAEFGYINIERGVFEPICFCPGFLRGLVFVGNFAVVGLSKYSEIPPLQGSVEKVLAEKKQTAFCGLHIIDLRSGEIVQWLKLEGIVEVLSELMVMQNVFRPMAIGTRTDEICKMIVLAEPQSL